MLYHVSSRTHSKYMNYSLLEDSLFFSIDTQRHYDTNICCADYFGVNQ